MHSSIALISFLSASTFLISGMMSSPFNIPEQTVLPEMTREQIKNGDVCEYSGRVTSDDPCTPWCVCRRGRAACAQIFCHKEENLRDSCGPIQVNGRCCPAMTCVSSNGTMSVTYNLPSTLIPPDIFSDDEVEQ